MPLGNEKGEKKNTEKRGERKVANIVASWGVEHVFVPFITLF